jgi:diaminopimelate decarboxylase
LPISQLDPDGGRPFHYREGELYCDDASLARMARDYGTPLYIYSAGAVRERFEMLDRAFGSQPHTLCYAVKANSNLSLLRLLASWGAGFDIVSGGELERVRLASPEALQRVVFSGVGKTAPEIDAALTAGILLFHLESEGELDLVAARAQKLKVKARVSLRVNPDVFADTHPYISTGLREHKFGVDISLARPLYRRMAAAKYLEPCGISVHIGSQIRSAKPFGLAVQRIAELARELERDGVSIRYVDAGGGFGIEYHAGNRFDAATRANEYIQTLRRAFPNPNVHWLLEPGRFIVAQAGCLLTRVLYIKRNGGRTFVITDAGMNDLIRPALYHAFHSIVPVTPRAGRARKVDIVGPVCETGDFFARDRAMPPLEPGDLVAILDAGAYGMSLSSNYNARPRATEVLVEGRKTRVIRRRETITDLLAPEMPID